MKENTFAKILAFSFPVLILLMILGVYFISPLIYIPETDFLYYYDENEKSFRYGFEVNDDGYIEAKGDEPYSVDGFYVYDVVDHEFVSADYEDVLEMKIDTSHESPDGFQYSYGFDGMSLMKNGYKVDLEVSDDMINKYSYSNFVGWITP